MTKEAETEVEAEGGAEGKKEQTAGVEVNPQGGSDLGRGEADGGRQRRCQRQA